MKTHRLSFPSLSEHRHTLIIERSTGSEALLDTDAEWIEDHAPCDVIEVSNLDHDTTRHIGVVTDEGPFDPTKVALADALATAVGATITCYSPTSTESPESRRNTIEDYLSELEALCESPVETQILQSGTDSRERSSDSRNGTRYTRRLCSEPARTTPSGSRTAIILTAFGYLRVFH